MLRTTRKETWLRKSLKPGFPIDMKLSPYAPHEDTS